MAKALKKGGLAGQPPLRFVHPDYTSVSLAKRPVDNVHGRRRTDHDFDGVESPTGRVLSCLNGLSIRHPLPLAHFPILQKLQRGIWSHLVVWLALAGWGGGQICHGQTYTWTTLAGGQGSGAGGFADGTGTAALFRGPTGVAVDVARNVYVADSGNLRIRKITPDGVVSTYAGSHGGFGSIYGVAVATNGTVYVTDPEASLLDTVSTNGTVSNFADISHPSGVGLDTAGNCYVLDGTDEIVEEVNPVGNVSMLGTPPLFFDATGVAVDQYAHVFVANSGSDDILLIMPGTGGTIGDTLAAGVPGDAGSKDGSAATALFNQPEGVAIDMSGNLYVADTGNQTIRLISAGFVSTIGGAPGNRGDLDGTNSAARFDEPSALALDSAGNLYVADYQNNRIVKGTPVPLPSANNQVVSMPENSTNLITLTGTDPNSLPLTYAVTVNPTNGALSGMPPNLAYTPYSGYIGQDSFQFTVNDGAATSSPATVTITVVGVTLTYTWTTLAGGQGSGAGGFADGTGTAALFRNPTGVAVDVAGNVYVADYGNLLIRKITPGGVVSTYAGSHGGFLSVYGIAVGTNGTVYVTDPEASLLDTVSTNGTVSSFADVSYPLGVGLDTAGNCYVLDGADEIVEEVNPAGNVSLLGTPPVFLYATGVAVDQYAHVFVANSGSDDILLITPGAGGAIGDTLVAGVPFYAGSRDGSAATALFNQPEGVAIDMRGNLYVADTGNQTIRLISAGFVSTIGGSPGNRGDLDGTNSAARFNEPTALAVDSAGNLYLADYQNNRIVKGTPVPVPSANNQVVSMPENSTNLITLTGTDPNSLPLTYAVTVNPTNGALSGMPPNLTYSPNPGYTGQDSFQFIVNDGTESSAPATVSITVVGISQTLSASTPVPAGQMATVAVPPTAAQAGISATLDQTSGTQTATVSVVSYAGTPPQISQTVGGPGTTYVDVQAQGVTTSDSVTASFSPPFASNDPNDPNLISGALVYYGSGDQSPSRVHSGNGGQRSGPILLNQSGPTSVTFNSDSTPTITQLLGTVFALAAVAPPTPGTNTEQTTENQPLSVATTNLLAGAISSTLGPLSISAVSAASAANGTVSLQNGIITYTPPSAFIGSDSFTYTLSDDLTNGTGTVSVTVAATNLDCTPPPSGLVSWWRGEGNANDSIGTNPGMLHGGVTYAQGEVGEGLNFDGGNDSYLLVPYSDSLAPGTSSFTIECWINPVKSTGYIWQQYAFGSLGSSGLDDIEIYIGTSLSGSETNTPCLALRDSSGSLQFLYSTNQLSDGQFHHIAAGRDISSQIMFLYVDGVEYTQALTATGSLFADGRTASLMIGDAYWCCGQPIGSYDSAFSGIIDEISYYDRALTSNEVQAIYNAGAAGKCLSLGTNLIQIVQQPTNSVIECGSNATLLVVATGAPPLIYQWQFNGTNLTDGGSIAGSAANVLTINNVLESDAGNYDVIVSNAYGVVTSIIANLTVTNPVVLPANLIVNGSFESPSIPTNSYTQGATPTSWSSSYDVGMVNGVSSYGGVWPLPEDSQQYAVLGNPGKGDAISQVFTITNPGSYVLSWFGSAPIYGDGVSSSPYSVTVTNAAQVALISNFDDYSDPPAWASHSLQIILVPGQYTLTFQCEAAARLENTLLDNVSLVAESTLPTNNLVENPGFETGDFTGWALSGNSTYDIGMNYKNVQIFGQYSPYFGNTPPLSFISQTVPTVPGLSYQFSFWLLRPYADTTGAECSVSWAGALIADLTGTNTYIPNATQFSFQETAVAASTVISLGFASPPGAFYLDDVDVHFVSLPISPVITMQPVSLTNVNGTLGSFAVTATGAPPLAYQWQFNGTNLTYGGSIAGSTTNVLTITNVLPSDAGNYDVIVSNVYGVVTSTIANLTVTNQQSPLDVTFYLVEKDQWWRQSGANNLAAATDSPGLYGPSVLGPASFLAEVDVAGTGAVSGVTLTLPNNSSVALTNDPYSVPPTYYTVPTFASQSLLDAAYPDGNYTLEFSTTDNGTVMASLNLVGDDYLSPNPPRFDNFAAAQAVDSAADFVLSWNTLSGGTTNDLVILRIYDSSGIIVFSTPIGPTELTGTSTSGLIPAGTLSPGQNYQAQLVFIRAVDFNDVDYPGATGIAEYATITTMSVVTIPADVSLYLVEKDQWWRQNGPTTLAAATNSPGLYGPSVPGPASFFVEVDEADPGLVSGVTLTLPNNSTLALTNDPYSVPPTYYMAPTFASQSFLDAAYPNGIYELSFSTMDNGTVVASLDLAGNDYLSPNPPLFSNFASAQSVNSAADFVLSWNPLSGGTSYDLVILRIYDTNGIIVFSTPVGPTELTGTSTSELIPADTLRPGQNYQAQLAFIRAVDVNDIGYPRATGFAEYATITTMSLVTMPVANPLISQPTFSAVAPGVSQFEFQISGQDGINYCVEISSDLLTWTAVVTNQTSGGSFVFKDNNVPGVAQRFYRVAVVP